MESGSNSRREEGQLIIDGIPADAVLSGPLKERLEQYQNTRSAILHDWLLRPSLGSPPLR